MVTILRKILNLPVVTKGFSWKDPPSWKCHNPSCTKIIKMRTLLFICDSCFSYWIYHVKCIFNRVRVMVFNTTFNNISFISWRSVLLMEETWVPRENHWPASNHWQTLSHNVVSSTPRLSGFELTSLVVMGTDCICSYKSNYYTITTAHIFNNIFVIL